MRGIRFMAALVLICTNSMFASEPGGNAAQNGSKEDTAKHVIQPPDVIQIEILMLIPKPPYRVEIFDVLQIRTNALSDQPINDYYMVEAEGIINLGPTYGSVHVSGMTIDEIRTTLKNSLHQWRKDPSVSVQLARVSGAQPVTGQYLVGPDGTINLHQYGVVKIAGKTVTEARVAIQEHLKQFLDSPELSVSVVDYNSKVYYIITQGAGLGDNVRRLPITGNETVLDAISQVNGLSQLSKKKIWIARPVPHNVGCQQILPINWEAITNETKTKTATNYQLLPGDRLFVAEDELATFSEVMAKDTAPVERIPGIASTSGSTIPTLPTTGRHYNATRNGL